MGAPVPLMSLQEAVNRMRTAVHIAPSSQEGYMGAVVLARLEQLEAVVRRAKFVRDSPAPYSVSRAAEQAAVAESARKILGPLAGEQ